MRQVATRILLAAAMASSAVVACDDNDDGTTTDTNNVGSGGANGGGEEDDGSSGARADGGTSVDGGTAATDEDASGTDASDDDPPVELSDGQIGAVTTAANNGEVAQANAALPKLTDADAEAFAEEMVMAHTAAQMRQAALLRSKSITPMENQVSEQLRTESDAIVAQLMAARDGVDVLYMDAQVTVHAKVLETLDTILLPSAEDADLKAELEATRAEVKAHHDHAQEILEALRSK